MTMTTTIAQTRMKIRNHQHANLIPIKWERLTVFKIRLTKAVIDFAFATDFALHTRVVEDVEVLRRSNVWIEVFGGTARTLKTSFVIVNSIRPKSMTLDGPGKDAKVTGLIVAHNAQKTSLLNRPESIKLST